MTANAKTGITVAAVCAAFSALALAFLSDSGGTHLIRPAIPLVDTNFLDTSTTRRSYADLVRAQQRSSHLAELILDEIQPRAAWPASARQEITCPISANRSLTVAAPTRFRAATVRRS